ncbi:glycosyl hydrolase [Mariniflexile sp.]|uniref:glycosyl hydrolase n=2 Tax=Mariniflexile sp. TaxID=1979402 RepID=UPI0040477219
MKNRFQIFFFAILFLASIFCVGQQAEINLEAAFKNPPERAKPRTWMHAMSGNMSKEGLTKDLEAIKDVGIGGVLLFNVSHTIPQGDVIFNSDNHQEMITHAAKECERLGLGFGVHNCDGWTSSGGPWNTLENSMKQVVWSEKIVEGGKKINITLEKPTAREGFYKDIAVVAYPSLLAEIEDHAVRPVITSSDDTFNTALVSDGRWDEASVLHASEKEKNWVQFDFGKPFGIKSAYMALTKTINGSRKSTLLTSNDGVNFSEAKTFDLKRLGKREFAIDETFPEIKARYFRIAIEDNYEMMEVSLNKRQNYPNFLAKTSMFKIEDDRLKPLESDDASSIINKNDIIDVTGSMDSNGNLSVKLPKGNWTILRFGFTTTGAVNSPASDAGRGLEVDKMSKSALKIHYDAYVGKVVQNTKAIAPNALQYLEIDSFEVGGQNWTDDYETYFNETYGHSLISFLPIYAGRIVESAKATDDVLWEVRQLNSHLITENYFGEFTKLTHDDGLISYIEPYSFNAPFNELDAAKQTDIPMGEFWMHQRYQTGTAVSGARIYGKKIISAESFSAQSEINWKGHPGMSKTTGDMAWILGINEFMFHRFAHQANTHVVPGMTMSQWGSHIDRTQTWWNNAGAAWFKYIARGSHLLRQGNPVSDVLVYVGEGAPNSITARNSFSTAIPMEINYDNINTDALLHRIEVENGKLVLPEGTSYKVLALHNCNKITLKTLEKIHELSQKGIIVLGEKPKEMAGYVKSKADLERFNKLVESIWNDKNTHTTFNWNTLFEAHHLDYDLIATSNKKQIPYIHRKTINEDIYFISNQDSLTQNINLKFSLKGKLPELWNPMTGKVSKIAYFKENGKGTEMDVPLNGQASVFVVFKDASQDKNQVVSLSTSTDSNPTFTFNNNENIEMLTEQNGDYEVVLKDGNKKEIKVSNIPEPKVLDKNWQLSFDAVYGYKNTMHTDSLFDWTTSSIFDIQHYSGTVAYSTAFNLSEKDIKSDQKITLDLGKVNIAAKVILNGQEVATLWIAPYQVDITNYIKKGKNELKIEVSNTWTNRLIGDEYYERTDGYSIRESKMPDWYTNNEPMPKGKRTTFSAYPFYEKTDKLVPSGMVGPVKIIFFKSVEINLSKN